MAQVATHRRAIVRNNTEDTEGQYVVDEVAQRSRFGGFNIGAAFFGWIVATGIGVLLTAILAAVGSAVAVSSFQGRSAQNIVGSVTNGTATNTVATVSLVSGALLLIAMTVAYFAGGYVAGRMSRFDGARQGVGVWIISLIVMLVLGALGAALGARYNVLQGLNLPHIPVNAGTLTTGGWITSILVLIMTLLASIGGSMVGVGYHRKVDSAGYDYEL